MSAAVIVSPVRTTAPGSRCSPASSRRAARSLFPSANTGSGSGTQLAALGGSQPAQSRPRQPPTTQAVAEMPSAMVSGTPSRRSNPLDSDVERVLLSAAEINERVVEIANQISEDLAGRDDVVMLGVLTGAFMFTSDLLKNLSIPAEVKFMKTSSYGKATESSGQVDISNAFVDAEDIEGRTVVIVEDIIDSGNTLADLVDFIKRMNPREVRIVCLLDKPARRQVDVPVNYIAFTIPDDFVIGYGLDFAEKYRCLPYIGVLKPEMYQ